MSEPPFLSSSEAGRHDNIQTTAAVLSGLATNLLLRALPPPDTDFPIEARQRWLQAAAAVFGIIYRTDDSARIITVEVVHREPTT